MQTNMTECGMNSWRGRPPVQSGSCGECDVLWHASPVSRPGDLVLWSGSSALTSCIVLGLWGRTVRCARAVHAMCEKLAVLHHRESGKFRRLKGRH